MSTYAPRIAIYNHSPNLLKLLKAVLSKKGYDVSTQLEESSDLDLFLQNPPDLLILGTIKGYIDGETDIIRKMREEPITAKLPIIICTTGEVHLAKDEQIMDLDYIRIVPKPFDIRDLTDAIEVALSGRSTYIEVNTDSPTSD